jgi:hypothetical protein
MDLSWVKEAYEKWIQGEDVNLEQVLSPRSPRINIRLSWLIFSLLYTV